jgi:hypothetical protein
METAVDLSSVRELLAKLRDDVRSEEAAFQERWGAVPEFETTHDADEWGRLRKSAYRDMQARLSPIHRTIEAMQRALVG